LKLEQHEQLLVEGVAEQDEVEHQAGAKPFDDGQDLIIKLKHPPYMIEELLESLDDLTFLVLQRDPVPTHHQGANDEAEHLDGEGLGGGNSKLRAVGDVDSVISSKFWEKKKQTKIPEDLNTSVKEVRGKEDQNGEVGELLQELAEGDTRVIKFLTHQEFSAPLENQQLENQL
jgi:hypothetical protein